MEAGKDDSASFNKASVLSDEEYRIIQLFEDGLSSEEIGQMLGYTKWTINYRHKQIKEKVEAYRQTHSIMDAMASGERPSLKTIGNAFNSTNYTRVGLVGCGKGALSLFDVFEDDEELDIRWIVEKNPSAVGLDSAMEFDLPVFESLSEVLDDEVDIVINLTDDTEVSDEIRRLMGPKVELMGGESAKFLWHLLRKKKTRLAQKEMILREREVFYHLGLLIENVDDLRDAGHAIADYATRLTTTNTAAVVMYDEEKSEAKLLASMGLDDDTLSEVHWPVNECLLSRRFISGTRTEPVFLENLEDGSTPILTHKKGGLGKIMVMPLNVEHRATGFILVANHEKESFTSEEISLFTMLCIFSAVSLERIGSIEKMRLLSMTDGLTGLCNQRSFMERLEQEIERSKRHGHNLSLIMLDIDRFKSYNDEFGHMEGNKLLKEFSHLMEDIARKTDVVARFGGEEFCLLLTEVEKEGAVILANRLKEAVASHVMPNRRVTVSGGVASYPKCADNHIDLLRKADIALYKAKNSGRNKICT